MDPQQRLLLEETLSALHCAGASPQVPPHRHSAHPVRAKRSRTVAAQDGLHPRRRRLASAFLREFLCKHAVALVALILLCTCQCTEHTSLCRAARGKSVKRCCHAT